VNQNPHGRHNAKVKNVWNYTSTPLYCLWRGT
jgi:hypothetical protein